MSHGRAGSGWVLQGMLSAGMLSAGMLALWIEGMSFCCPNVPHPLAAWVLALATCGIKGA